MNVIRYLSVFAFALAFAGMPSVARAADTVEVRVSNHVCAPSSDVRSYLELSKLKSIADKLAACPTAGPEGGEPTLRVRNGRTIADIKPSEYMQSELCMWELEGGDDSDSSRADQECFDTSHFIFTDVPKGSVTVMSGSQNSSRRFGALDFHPAELTGRDTESLVSFTSGIINLNTSADDDGVVMIHLFSVPSATDTAASVFSEPVAATTSTTSDEQPGRPQSIHRALDAIRDTLTTISLLF